MTISTRPALAALLLGAATSVTGIARAEDAARQEITGQADLGGYALRVIETESFDQALMAGETELLKDALLFLDGPVEVAGQTVITGISGAGGNACNGTPFIVSLRDGAPKVDGPIDSCSWFEMTVQPDALVFHTEASPGNPAEIWTWSPVSGLTEALEEDFTPDETLGWDDFDWLSDKHPVDALGFAPVYAQMSAGLSAAGWQDYTAILGQLGSGGLVAQGYGGNACTKAICDTEWAWLWIDRESRQAVAFWKSDEDEEPQSWPEDPATWPDWIAEAASQAAGSGG